MFIRILNYNEILILTPKNYFLEKNCLQNSVVCSAAKFYYIKLMYTQSKVYVPKKSKIHRRSRFFELCCA